MDYLKNSKKMVFWVGVIAIITVGFRTQSAQSGIVSLVGNMDPFLVILEREVTPGNSFRVLAVSEQPLSDVRLTSGQSDLNGRYEYPTQGPPYALTFQVMAPQTPGDYPFCLVNGADTKLACTKVAVRLHRERRPRPSSDSGVWQIRRSWNDNWERVFSVWIAHLFRPIDTQPRGWRQLDKVLHNRERNFLYNRLGYQEDDPQNPKHVRAIADCGDAPYQLRAYFSWKFDLAFRYRRCTRGNRVKGPVCRFDIDNRTTAFDKETHPIERFNDFIDQGIALQVHSGSMRTLPGDEASDFYPIALNRESIRPGTVFVDVSGHALIVTQWDKTGLFAIDGHPDKTVTRRRFSKRFFKYFRGTQTGGFKAFRPVKMDSSQIVPQPNNMLTKFFSSEQYRFHTPTAFYRQMNRLIQDVAAGMGTE